MTVRCHRKNSGFTLTELAIVLAVIGVLVAGLWNLLSGANEQVRDQSAASQQTQLISAVKAFLNSSNGQSYMIGNTGVAGGCGGPCAQGASFALPLPTTTACTTYADANWQAFCTFLPPGTITTTTNAYRQTFQIRVLRDAATAAGLAPATYSFMIIASGPQVIPDTSGARISSLIGGDGGFVFNNNVCGVPTNNMACGAFGGWSANVVGA